MGFITSSQFVNGLTASKNYIDGITGTTETPLSERITVVEGLIDGHSVGANVPADAVFTDTVYDDTELVTRVSANETAITGCYTKTEVDDKINAALGDIETLLAAI